MYWTTLGVARPLPNQLLLKLHLIFLFTRLAPVCSFSANAFVDLFTGAFTSRSADLRTGTPNIVDRVAGAVDRAIFDITELFLDIGPTAFGASILWGGIVTLTSLDVLPMAQVFTCLTVTPMAPLAPVSIDWTWLRLKAVALSAFNEGAFTRPSPTLRRLTGSRSIIPAWLLSLPAALLVAFAER